MRVIDVSELGWDAAIIDIEGQTIVLIETTLDTEDRIDVLSRVMATA